MEANTCYLGIELNDSYAMVSYMQPNMEEPETVSTIAGSENYRIPTLLARRKNVGMWYYGEDAGRMAKTSEVICVDSLLRRAAASEVITIAKESYDAVDLLALFIKKVIELPQKLGNTSHVTGIVLTVDHLTKELIGIFRHVAELLGLSQETFAVIDDKESFYAFAMNQEKSLWMHDVFLFSCGKNAVSSYDLSRDMHTKPQMITMMDNSDAKISMIRLSPKPRFLITSACSVATFSSILSPSAMSPTNAPTDWKNAFMIVTLLATRYSASPSLIRIRRITSNRISSRMSMLSEQKPITKNSTTKEEPTATKTGSSPSMTSHGFPSLKAVGD